MARTYHSKPFTVEAYCWRPGTDEPMGGPVPEWIKKAMDVPLGKPGSIFRYGDVINLYGRDGHDGTCYPGDYMVYDSRTERISAMKAVDFERDFDV